jgi:hypothetical protein
MSISSPVLIFPLSSFIICFFDGGWATLRSKQHGREHG